MFNDGMEVYAAAVAASKKYTDETLGGGGGSQGKVVIDLDEYGITTALGGLFQSGGGKTRVDDVGDFWEVNTEGTIVVSFTFFGLVKICTSNVTTIRNVDAGSLVQLCFGFDIYYFGNVYRGAVMIIGEDTSANVILDLDIAEVA